MGKRNKYPAELRERAVRMVFGSREEHGSQWATIRSVADTIGCAADSVRRWVRQAEKDQRAGLTASEKEYIRELEREKRELEHANAILRAESASLARAGLDRRPK